MQQKQEKETKRRLHAGFVIHMSLFETTYKIVTRENIKDMFPLTYYSIKYINLCFQNANFISLEKCT